MEIAKITSKGQITLPIRIREKLGVKDGDQVLFVEEDDGRILVVNASIQALLDVQSAFSGVAEELGVKNEQDVVRMVKEVRAERAK